MDELFIVLILVSPILLVVGLIKPNLFRKLFGKVPSRIAVAKLSGALFAVSFVGAGMTLEPIDPIKEADSAYVESTPTEETPVPPSLEKTAPEEEKETEEDAPKIETVLPDTPTQEVEPEVEVPEEEYIYIPPVVEPTPQEPAPATPSYICSYNAYNCDDFGGSWSEANEVYNYCISIGAGDIHDLDRDNDGACDSLK
jgi:hypothetical protein